MSNLQYIVRVGTAEHYEASHDYLMRREYGEGLEDAKRFFRAIRDMVDTNTPYIMKVTLIESHRDEERIIDTWLSPKLN